MTGSTGKGLVRAISGHSHVRDQYGDLILSPDALYTEGDLLKPEQRPTGYAYHGTRTSLVKVIAEDALRSGGSHPGSRYMVHMSPWPAGDRRNIGGARYDAEATIEVDVLGWKAWNLSLIHI